jgi:hypothetical protein
MQVIGTMFAQNFARRSSAATAFSGESIRTNMMERAPLEQAVRIPEFGLQEAGAR